MSLRGVTPTLALAVTLILVSYPKGRASAEVSALTRALRHETSTLATLESIAEWMLRAEEELDDAIQLKRQLEQRISEAERRVAALESRAEQRRRELQLRIRSLYKMSRGGLIRLVLEAADEQQLATRLSAASLILRRDVRELDLYKNELRRLAEEKRALQAQHAHQRELGKGLRDRQAELKRARTEQLATLQQVEASRRSQQSLARELDGHQRSLLRKIAAITRQLESAGGFAAKRGSLPRPVHGPVVGTFGQALDSTRRLTIVRHGLTMRPEPRARVRAVADGAVRLAGPLGGYGNVILLEHSDGYFSLYGFLSKLGVKEGEAVTAGSQIGRAGLDPLTGESGLYLEIRRRERPLDAAAWLRR